MPSGSFVDDKYPLFLHIRIHEREGEEVLDAVEAEDAILTIEQDADGLTAFVASLTRSVDFAHGLLK